MHLETQREPGWHLDWEACLPRAFCSWRSTSALCNYNTHKGPRFASPGHAATSRVHILPHSLNTYLRAMMHNVGKKIIQYNERKSSFCIAHLHHIAISQTYFRCVTFWTALAKRNCHGYLRGCCISDCHSTPGGGREEDAVWMLKSKKKKIMR